MVTRIGFEILSDKQQEIARGKERERDSEREKKQHERDKETNYKHTQSEVEPTGAKGMTIPPK